VPEFQALSFFSPGEVISTKILSYLLNPHALHGQGDMFLNTFLDALEIDLERKKPQSVVVSAPPFYTDARRRQLDILILFRAGDTEYAVVVESKSHGAPDREDQMRDYLRWLRLTYPSRQKQLVYLKDGTRPSDKSISVSEWDEGRIDGICSALSFRDVMDVWLKRSERACRVDKLKLFLEDFASFMGLGEKGEDVMSAVGKRIVAILREKANEHGSSAVSDDFEGVLAIYDLHNEIWKTAIRLFMIRTAETLRTMLPEWETRYDAAGESDLETIPPKVDLVRRSIGMYLTTGPDPKNGAATLFIFYISGQRDLWPNLSFGSGKHSHLMQLGTAQLWEWTRPVGVADIKSADGIRSLLTEQASYEIASTFARLATAHWEQIQQASDQA
jgi:hypothetical protein